MNSDKMENEKKDTFVPTNETEGGPEARTEDVPENSLNDDEKVREEKKDPAVPQRTQVAEKQLEDDAKKEPMERPTGKLVHGDEQTVPARNDPFESAAPDVLRDPTATSGLDRDQSLGFTTEGPTEGVAQVQVQHVPDAPHREPSTYTPSGARPGQQNPVNPQGSPGANPLDPGVGARPLEAPVVTEEGRDGDYTKVITPGEKNASQRGYEIDHQPADNNY